MWMVAAIMAGLSACGGSGGASGITAPPPDPVIVEPAVIASLSPASVPAGGAAPTLTISGSRFASGAAATYNGSARTTNFVSTTELAVTLTSADVATTGSYPVIVTNPGAKASNTVNFSVSSFGISSLNPASSPTGVAQLVQIVGFGFINTDTVTYNGITHASNFVSANRIDITLSATETATAGIYPIVVIQGTASSNTVNFEVAQTRVTAVSPVGVVANTTPFTLTIIGAGFTPTPIPTVTVTNSTGSVSYNVANVNVESSTRITATVTLDSNPIGNYVNVAVSGATSPVILGAANALSTLSGNVQSIFNTSCTNAGCHNSVAKAGSLVLASDSAYANLINVASSGCSGALRVVPGDPRTVSSILVDKLTAPPPCAGSAMPKTGSISAANVQTIVDWVAQGAPP